MAELPLYWLIMTKFIHLQVINYPGATRSAVYGLEELFEVATRICQEQSIDTRFDIAVVTPADITKLQPNLNAIILPPSLHGSYYLAAEHSLLNYLKHAHQTGVTLSSACAGAFILAQTDLLNSKSVTTHWQLEDAFTQRFPRVNVDINKILIEDQNIITAGGIMSWLDLGLELVARFSTSAVMRTLGKFLIVDTGRREQRYYQSFQPKVDHANQAIIKVQHYIQQQLANSLSVLQLSQQCHMSERTLLRQFHRSTGYKPLEYIQRVRIQKACELLENSSQNIDNIAAAVGYNDVNSFRKRFTSVIGITPSEFRKRFK